MGVGGVDFLIIPKHERHTPAVPRLSGLGVVAYRENRGKCSLHFCCFNEAEGVKYKKYPDPVRLSF
jgi:hypothetical protein